MNETWMQIITIIGTNFVLILGMIGTFVGLHVHAVNKTSELRVEQDKKSEQNRCETRDIINSIKEEMKDFHLSLLEIEKGRK